MLRGGKRKTQAEENDDDLEGVLKRIKITPTTAGELRYVIGDAIFVFYLLFFKFRLQKDVEEIRKLYPFQQIVQGPKPCTVTIMLLFHGLTIHFSVTVPKYYPHNAPVVKCERMDKRMYSPFISTTGEVSHSILNDWNALCSLRDVVIMLGEICANLVPV